LSSCNRIPRVSIPGAPFKAWSPECATWPRYEAGEFRLENASGASMIDLTQEERRALQIVVLRTSVEKEQYGGSHHFNWKKVGLSRAYYMKHAVNEASMPTPRAKAAFRFLMLHNRFYEVFQKKQAEIIRIGASFNISSYDLFIVCAGIECAMYPYLYPTTNFTDTGILQHYQHVQADDTNRVLSIGLSWTRKVLSSVRAYGEQRDLPFFLYLGGPPKG
jgi:hypothetical protein